MHRGSGTVQLGDPVWMIESVYPGTKTAPGYSMFKTFPSLAGFKAGLRAVKDDVGRHTQHGVGPREYKTFVIDNPQWQPCDDEGNAQ